MEQERLDELKHMHETLTMTEYVDACEKAIPKLIAEIERMREIVRDAVKVAERDKHMAQVAYETDVGGAGVIDVAEARGEYSALKNLANRLGIETK